MKCKAPNAHPPDEHSLVGLILCTDKDAAEVHYATAGMDQQLFVARYLVALPPAGTVVAVVA